MIRDFLSRLFPPDLLDYIPGPKLIAAVIAYVIAEAFGANGDVVTLPVVGEINVHEIATILAFYLWPDDGDVEDDLEDDLLDAEPDLVLDENDEIEADG